MASVDAKFSPEDIKNLQRNSRKLRILGLIPCFIFAYLGMPIKGLAVAQIASFASTFLCPYSTPSFQADKFFLSIFHWFGPIWIFFIDSCSFTYAMVITIANILEILIEHKEKRARFILLFTLIGSWMFASLACFAAHLPTLVLL